MMDPQSIQSLLCKILVAGIFFGTVVSCKQEKSQHSWFGMDTRFSITLYGKKSPPPEEIFRLLKEETSRLEKVFSDYDSTSEISAIQGDSGDILLLNAEVYSLLKFTAELSSESKGAFNINLHKLKALWGLGTGETPRVPGEQEIADVMGRSRVSGESDTSFPIQLLGNKRVMINRKDVYLDLGAVVKGHTADHFSRILDSLGYSVHLITVGGEVHTGGKKPGGSWRIGVRHPRIPKDNVLAAVITLQVSGSVSTSGDYERYFIKDGMRYHHIFNPFTGYPAGNFCSVTVMSSSSKVTDALSTALFVLGPRDGKQLLQHYNAEAMWIKEEKGGLCAIITPGLREKTQLYDISICREELL
jgi:thiamine biosynthesis lipoprotein